MVFFCRFLKLQIFTILIAFGTPAFGDTVLSAKQDDVKVFAAPDKNAAPLGQLKKDETISAGERQGMYWSVTTKDGQKGFVSMMQVKPAVQSATGGLSDALRTAVQESRNDSDQGSMRARSAVMGVRGLDEQSETEFAGNVKPNLRMVYDMEETSVTSQAVDSLEASVAQEVERKMSGPAAPEKQATDPHNSSAHSVQKSTTPTQKNATPP